MRVGSLFAGIGGFDLAAERAGHKVVWQSEIDSHASRVLDHHWPAVKNLGDVHGITDAPGVDVLTGGFPCQDYSVAGSRGGLAGDRGALWWEYHRLISRLRPTWVVGENVPGLLSSRDGRDFETIVGSLTECGYGVAWAVLDAQYYGVAQRRRRVFIVGHSGGKPRPEVLALSEGLYGHPEPRQETGKGVAALTHNGLGGGGGPDDNLAQAGHLLAFDWQAGGDHTSSGAFKQDGSTPTLGTVGRLAFAQNQRDELRELEVASSVSAERWGTAKNETLVATVERTCDHAGCSRPVFPNSDSMFCEEHQECDEGLALSFRTNQTGAQGPIHSTEVTDTLAEDHPPAVISSSVRRLTPLECERLQGFPDGWTDIPGNSDTQRYRQLGNAVAVPVAEWIMRRL